MAWRPKLVADFGAGPATEIELGRIEGEACAVPETLGLSLDEGKRRTAASQTEMVRAQASAMGERFRCRAHCGPALSSKGYRCVTFRSLFGDVPLRVRRFVSCQIRGLPREPRSFPALTLEGGMAPELAYVTAKFAALAPFARVADLLAELLPAGGAVRWRRWTMEIAASRHARGKARPRLVAHRDALCARPPRGARPGPGHDQRLSPRSSSSRT